jgi:hypothetical protein
MMARKFGILAISTPGWQSHHSEYLKSQMLDAD